MYVATMPKTLDHQLGQDFVGFIHSFGMLRSDTTPCGQPMSVSTAHALCELRAGPPLNQRDLATRLGLTTSSVSRLVDQLETKSWAHRAADPDTTDSRVRLVLLTDHGRKIADQVLEARAKRFAELLEAVPRDKQGDVLQALTLLKEAADAIA
jgi:DNA-binding MarR family transcriptional regulator